METIRGRKSLVLDLKGLKNRLANHNHVVLDLGAGDGRYARTLAGEHPDWFVLGLDTCRENLREYSQAKRQNLLFVIASAQELPEELNGLASQISINFPWGSLLESLLVGDALLLHGLERVSGASASLDVCLNGGAFAEAGTTLDAGTHRIHSHLVRAGWQVKMPILMDGMSLRNFPSTWAKRLAFGRDPRALVLSGKR